VTEDQAREIQRKLASMSKGELNLLLASVAERSILNPGQAIRFMMGISAEWSYVHGPFTLARRDPNMSDDEAKLSALSVDLYMTLVKFVNSGNHTPGTILNALAFAVYTVVNDLLEQHPLPQDALDLAMRHGVQVIMKDEPVTPLTVEE